MITAVIPTYNRAYTLKTVLKNVFRQKGVNEIILVDDHGTDDTNLFFQEIKLKYPQIHCVYLRNDKNMGATFSRMRGVREASNSYILFCDDDDLLQDNYTEVCLPFISDGIADIVTGRHFYRLPNESVDMAIKRYRTRLTKGELLNRSNFTLRNDVQIEKYVSLPFSHGILLTTKKLLDAYCIDYSYASGNGYREETDFQVRAFIDGKAIIMCDDTHAVGMNRSEVKTGGQRVTRFSRYYWTIRYSLHFYKKYYKQLRVKLNLRMNFMTANIVLIIYETYRFFIRPFYILLKRFLSWGNA